MNWPRQGAIRGRAKYAKYEDFLELSVKQSVEKSSPISLG